MVSKCYDRVTKAYSDSVGNHAWSRTIILQIRLGSLFKYWERVEKMTRLRIWRNLFGRRLTFLVTAYMEILKCARIKMTNKEKIYRPSKCIFPLIGISGTQLPLPYIFFLSRQLNFLSKYLTSTIKNVKRVIHVEFFFAVVVAKMLAKAHNWSCRYHFRPRGAIYKLTA